MTDPSERIIDSQAMHCQNCDTWQAIAIRTSRRASAQTAPPADRQRMNRVRSDHRAIAALIAQEPTFDDLR